MKQSWKGMSRPLRFDGKLLISILFIHSLLQLLLTDEEKLKRLLQELSYLQISSLHVFQSPESPFLRGR